MGPVCPSKPDILLDDGWRFPMKAMILAALIGIGAACAQAAAYHTPAYDYYQNNWTAG
jgi:hypothetical protein